MNDDSAFIKWNGLDIAYRMVGTGSPLLLLHGVLGDSRDWAPQLDGLSDEFTVVAWDAPGCGRSSDPPDSFTWGDYVSSLVAFIDALRLERPHVLGLSWGSGLALGLHQRAPALPRSLVLAGAYAGWAGSLPPEEIERRLSRVLREANMPPEQFVPDWLPTLFASDAPPEIVEGRVAIMSEFHPVGYRTMIQAFATLDLGDHLPLVDVPTLLIAGDQDIRSPLSVAEDLHARIPDSHLVILSGAAHVSNIEVPDRFNAAVRDFLRSVTV
jgi:pimeloyl-ACP methyl ester carboxylesterase